MNEAERYWAKFFKDICPYTGKKCEDWNCDECEVEKAERKFAEGEEEKVSLVGTWVETKDNKIIEVTAETNVSYFGRIITHLDPELKYGEMVEVQKEDLLDEDL